jgi:hypothetical protein
MKRMWVGEKEGSYGTVKDASAGKGGQEISNMPLVRGKGTVFAQERA